MEILLTFLKYNRSKSIPWYWTDLLGEGQSFTIAAIMPACRNTFQNMAITILAGPDRSSNASRTSISYPRAKKWPCQ